MENIHMTFEEYKSFYLASCSSMFVKYEELRDAYIVYLNSFYKVKWGC